MASTVTQGSSTLTVSDNSIQTGNFADGPGWLYVPSGTVSCTGITPNQTTVGGYIVNGAVNNPPHANLQSNSQGFDNRCGEDPLNEGLKTNYSSGLSMTYPTTLTAGDCVWKSVYHSHSTLGQSALRTGIFDEMNCFFVVDFVPSAAELSPVAASWPSKSGHSRVVLTDTIANLASALPSLDFSGVDTMPIADVLGYYNKWDPSYGLSRATTSKSDTTYQALQVYTGRGNYGRDQATRVNAALWHLIGNEASTAQKETLLLRFISQGVQMFGAYVNGQLAYGGNGGHHQFHQGAALIAAKYTNQFNEADLGMYAQGNIFGQAFEMTQAFIDTHCIFHADGSKPPAYHRHTISSVSGLNVTCNQPRGGIETLGCRIVRESDGADAVVLSRSGATHTIDAQPSPAFSSSDVVNFQRDPAPTAGDVDWNIQGSNRLDQPASYNPSWRTNYRGLQNWTAQLAVPFYIGAWDSSLQYALDYTELAMESDKPTTTNIWQAHDDSIKDDGGTAHAMDTSVWSNHWATIKAGAGGGTGPVAPTLVSSVPVDDATGISRTAVIELNFSKTMQAGISGNITVRADSGGFSDLEVFDITDPLGTSPGDIEISGTVVRIRLTSAMAGLTEHSVRIDSGALRDTESTPNNFAGIADDTTLSFTTVAATVSVANTITFNINVGG